MSAPIGRSGQLGKKKLNLYKKENPSKLKTKLEVKILKITHTVSDGEMRKKGKGKKNQGDKKKGHVQKKVSSGRKEGEGGGLADSVCEEAFSS